jgi:hypothetical protein
MWNRAALLLVALTISAAAQTKPEAKRPPDLGRDSTVHIVTQIQRADYEGDRDTLKRLHDELTHVTKENKQT